MIPPDWRLRSAPVLLLGLLLAGAHTGSAQPGPRSHPQRPAARPSQADAREFIRDLFDKTTRPRRLEALEQSGTRPQISARHSSGLLAPSEQASARIAPAGAPDLAKRERRLVMPPALESEDPPAPRQPSAPKTTRDQPAGAEPSQWRAFGVSEPKDSAPAAARGYPRADRPVPSNAPLPEEARQAVETGRAAFEAGRVDEAAAAFELARQSAPDHPVVLSGLGAVAFRQGDVRAAADHLAAAVARDLNAAPAWQMLGVARLESGDLPGALAALAQAVYLEPGNARANSSLGVVMSRMGFFDAAEEFFMRAVQAGPDDAEAHFNLAVICLRRDPPAIELARRHYRRAVSLGAEKDPALEALLEKTQ